jgi:hypothetical protein
VGTIISLASRRRPKGPVSIERYEPKPEKGMAISLTTPKPPAPSIGIYWTEEPSEEEGKD